MTFKQHFLAFFSIIKHWRLKPLQLLLMMVGLIGATALWNSVHLINTEAKKAYSDAQTISSISAEKILISKDGLDFSDDYFGELRKSGWPVTPRVAGDLQVQTKTKNTILT